MPQSKWILEQVVFGGVIYLEEGLSTIGRNQHSTIVASSDYVSRNHAKIDVSPDNPDDIQITDLGSTNGIFVNDYRHRYCNAPCKLNAGDRIGIGVYVDDCTVSDSPNGKYPIYLLKRTPEEPVNGILTPPDIDNDAVPKPPDPPDQLLQDKQVDLAIDETDYELDDVNEKDDFVMPQTRSGALLNVKKEPEPATLPEVETEASAANVISENIKSIFGDLNAELLSTLSEETRKIAETSTSMQKLVVSEDVICISSSEDEDSEAISNRPKKAKSPSPELFGDSFNSDADNPEDAKQKIVKDSDEPSVSTEAKAAQENNNTNHQISEEIQKLPSIAVEVDKPPDPPIPDNEDSDKPQENNIPITDPPVEDVKHEFNDSVEDDLFFTQKLFEEMKECIADSNGEDAPEFKIEPEDTDLMLPTKHEIYPENLDGMIINLDDDEEDEFDEAIDSELNKWSVHLYSQSFSNSFNASQVYEDETNSDDEPAQRSKNIFIIDDDDDEQGFDFADRVADVVVKTERKDDEVAEEPRRSASHSPEKDEIPQKAVKTLQKTLFSSSSEEEEKEEDDDEEKDENDQRKQSKSSSSLKTFHEKIIRRLSTCEEVPNKKARLSSRSDDNEKEELSRPSSSHRTYSKKSSGSKRSRSALRKEVISPEEDLFEKLKKDDKSKKSSSSSSKTKKPTENSKPKESSSHTYQRSKSTTDETTKSTYKSATVARRQSVGSNFFVDNKDDAEDFMESNKKTKEEPTAPPKVCEENKKSPPQVPQGSVTVPLKMLRGPPEIIAPPTLPITKGKLRGVSAAHQRITEKLKATACNNDLKRKWLEKPSEKKDKEKARARKEDIKKKLKELNDKKQSDNVSSNAKAKEITTSEKEASRKKLKVKVTHANRGAFLTELPTNNSKQPYKIPKKHSKPNESSSRTSNESSKTKPKVSPPKNGTKKPPEQQKTRTEIPTDFAQVLAQVDKLLQKKTTSSSRDRIKSTDTANEQKVCAPPRQSSKKVNFNTANQQFEEHNRLIALQEQLQKRSNLSSPASQARRGRRVTFKLPPEIHYIESISNATRKPCQKESSTFNERKNVIRRRFAIVDKTEALLDDVLSWSQLWLQNKQIESNMLVYPMTNQFQSFNNYKSILVPLLKMEYLGYLAKGMEQYTSIPFITADIDYSAPHKHREILFAKCNTPIKQSDLAVHDLILIEVVVGSITSQYFGVTCNIRRTGTCNCIDIEVAANTIRKDVLKMKPRIKIRRIIDGIFFHLRTFNAVFQLEQTPLIEKILNPFDLLKVKNNYRTSSIEYKGFNGLNIEQRNILLKTYERAIDQFNPNVTLINGPPGTGKSVLISNLAIQLLYGNEVHQLDKKILICAQSNMAVDVIAEKLLKIRQKLSPETAPYHVVRFGMDDKIHPNVRDISLKSLLQRHRLNMIRMQSTQCNEQMTNGKNLTHDIVQLEARIADLEINNYTDVRQEELIELRRNLELKKAIVNQGYRPDEEKRLNKWFLEHANIVCSTLSSCVKLANFLDYFDICIIDEATQCTEPWTLLPLRFGVSNLVMVGDTQQLPATVISQSARELGLEMSLFTRIQKCLENNYKESTDIPEDADDENMPIFTLREQYRMHSEISKWPNMYFYKNKLKNNPKTDEFKSSIRPFSILNLEYRQNDSQYGQISNSLEAEFVTKLVTTLNNYIPNKFFSYGVITPYAHHREKLELMIRNSGLTDIMVNTIDSYQGIEKDVIIISNARTHGVGFLANYQRLNVALTRPKKCLILCGSFKNLESVPSWASLLADAKQRGLYHNISTSDALDITKNVIEKIKIKR